MNDRPYTFDRTVRLLIAVVVLTCLFLITRRLSGVLLPFIVSWFVAYLLHPLVTFFQVKCRLRNRTLSVIVTLILLCCLLTAVIWGLSKPVASEVSRMSAIIASYLSGINADALPAAWQDWLREWLAKVDIQSLLSAENITAIASKLSGYIGGIVGGSISLLSGLFVLFICVLYLIFILIDYEKISHGMITIVPPKYRAVVGGILHDLQEGMNRYFRGQAVIASCVGVLFAIGFSIIHLPLAIIVGLFVGLLNMVPYLQAVGIPICMLLGIFQSVDTGTAYWIVLIGIAAVFIVVQLIQDLVLNPLIMGNVIGMNPAVMLLALSIWGSLLGVAGMIIALPITTVIISYYQRYVLRNEPLTPSDPSLPPSEPASAEPPSE